jgi:hypothetical protein
MTKKDFENNPTKTIKTIAKELYSVIPNPRYITLMVFLEVNHPELNTFSQLIWDFLHTDKQLLYIPHTKSLIEKKVFGNSGNFTYTEYYK